MLAEPWAPLLKLTSCSCLGIPGEVCAIGKPPTKCPLTQTQQNVMHRDGSVMGSGLGPQRPWGSGDRCRGDGCGQCSGFGFSGFSSLSFISASGGF